MGREALGEKDGMAHLEHGKENAEAEVPGSFPGDPVIRQLASVAVEVRDGTAEPTICMWNEDIKMLVDITRALFRQGLRRSMAPMTATATPSFWPFVRQLSDPETVDTIGQLPRTLPLFKNQTERENAWIICSLNQAKFSAYLQAVRDNPRLTELFYAKGEGALLTSPDALDELGRIWGVLETKKFNLAFKGYVEYLEIRSCITIVPKSPEEAPAPSAAGGGLAGSDEEPERVASSSNTTATVLCKQDLQRPAPKDSPLNNAAEAPNSQLDEHSQTKRTPRASDPDRECPSPVPTPMENSEKALLSPGPRCESVCDELGSSSSLNENVKRDSEGFRELQCIIKSRMHRVSTMAIKSGEKASRDRKGPLAPDSESQKSLPSASPASLILRTPNSGVGFFGFNWNVTGLFGSIVGAVRDLTQFGRGLDSLAAKRELMGDFEDYKFELEVCPMVGLEAQQFKCQQCQGELDAHSSRLCDISGRYYCPTCFGTESMVSPARVLKDWDFCVRPVAAAVAAEVRPRLRSSLLDPALIAPDLWRKAGDLSVVDRTRCKVILALGQIVECPSGIYTRVMGCFCSQEHLILTRELFTIEDLISLDRGELRERLLGVLEVLSKHVKTECSKCRAVGQFCQMCMRPELIYRFDCESVCECPHCGRLSHVECASTRDVCRSCCRVFMTLIPPSTEPAWLEIE